ncbi:MAG: amidohydrolase family protein, partial [Bacteroidia bacterium]|nr:amidohydrolase family protein [Bacteroidia bacterium]
TRFPISAETAKLLRDRGVVWVPVLMRAKDDAALLADLQRTMFLADSMGVLIGSGAEAGESVYMGESLLDELGLLHDAGISTVHILQAATSVAARALGMEDSWGYVRPGYRANLILVEGNIQVEFSALSRLRYLWQIGHLTIGEGLLVGN